MDDLILRTVIALLLTTWHTGWYLCLKLYPEPAIREPRSLSKAIFGFRGGWFALFYGLVLLQLVGWTFGARISSSSQTTVLTMQAMGLALAILGATGTLWARISREETWAGSGTNPTLVPGHRLVTKGPYRFVRHPFYLSLVLYIVGIQLTLTSWLVLAVIPFLIYITRVARKEGEDLARVYGESYRLYTRRTFV